MLAVALLAVLLLGLFLAGWRRPVVPEAAGLEPALLLLGPGADVSGQYHRLLVTEARAAGAAYARSFVAPVPQAVLDTLVLHSTRASAAADELVWRAPPGHPTRRRLKRGARLLERRLRAWRDEARLRAGLELHGRDGPEWNGGL